MLSWTLTFCIFGAILLGWFWQSSLSARERANHAAQDACARMQLQFLDGTVAFASLRLARNEAGRLSLRRTYVFDYTAMSIERRQGFVVMLGQRIEHIGFENHEQSAHTATPAQRRTDLISSDNNVLDLEDWRRRRAAHPELRHRTPTGAGGHSEKDPRHNANHDPNQDNGW